MDVQALTWVVLVAGASVAGAAFVGVLVVPARLEALVAVIGLVGFGLAAYSLVDITTRYSRIDAVLYAFAFILASSAGGWALASVLLGRLARTEQPVASLEEAPPERGGSAVIIAACVEPVAYETRTTATMLECLFEEGLIEPSLTALPFMFFGQKARYRAIGGTSPSQAQLKMLAERLETPLARSGVTLVDWAKCTGTRRIAPRVLDAVNSGYRRIVVAELTVGESLQMSAALRELDGLRLEQLGVEVSYTGPLAVSDSIATAVTNRILAASDEPAVTGAVLVGHGQPDERAARNPSYDENELGFLNRVRMLLIDRGIPENNIRIAWAEWNNPDVTSAVRHLAALGCRRVVVSPAVFPVDSIEIRLDLEIAVRQARVEQGVIVVTLPAWRDDSHVVDEVVKRVEAELQA